MTIQLPPLLLAVAILFGPLSAFAQRPLADGSPGPRTDILTGEPVRPRSGPPRPEPEIFNAPHAPPQAQRRPGDDPPIAVYVTPQFGAGTGQQRNGRPTQTLAPTRDLQGHQHIQRGPPLQPPDPATPFRQ